MKLEINYRKKNGNRTNAWGLNILLKKKKSRSITKYKRKQKIP